MRLGALLNFQRSPDLAATGLIGALQAKPGHDHFCPMQPPVLRFPLWSVYTLLCLDWTKLTKCRPDQKGPGCLMIAQSVFSLADAVPGNFLYQNSGQTWLDSRVVSGQACFGSRILQSLVVLPLM